DRRVAIRGLLQAYRISSKLQPDIIDTQTEFSIGLMGKLVAKMLKIPCVHTYHTMYEDYLHYVAKGKVLRPKHVRLMTRSFCQHLSGVIAPSDRVLAKLQEYQVTTPVEVIPTGIDVSKFQQPEYLNYRAKYGLTATTPVILTLSRVAYEKDIDRLIT
ncbi:glycosyltransferase, partial [Mediterraneibacter glycyrrhizinilyticus]